MELSVVGVQMRHNCVLVEQIDQVLINSLVTNSGVKEMGKIADNTCIWLTCC